MIHPFNYHDNYYVCFMCILCILTWNVPERVHARNITAHRKLRHDVDLIRFIRNASSNTNIAKSDIKRQRGQSEYGTKKIARNKVVHRTDSSSMPSNGDITKQTSSDSINDLRHSSLSDWKKKKKETRLAQKASGIKPPAEAGVVFKEFEALEREVLSGGRMMDAPCSPPHCSFRCLTDDTCVTHPLMKSWQPPEPKMCGSRPIYPISFSIPESEVVGCVPVKTTEFGTVVPLREKSYVFGPADEAEYKRDYRKAFFGITRKKEGWDCMRHYEIMASGSVPMFLDIRQTPHSVLTHLPLDLLRHVREQPFFKVEGCEMKHILTTCNIYLDLDQLDLEEYASISCSLLQHTRQHLTTKAMARYTLDMSGALAGQPIPSSFRALFIGGAVSNSDYLRDLMFHGYRDLLGENLLEYNTPRYMYESVYIYISTALSVTLPSPLSP